MDSAELIEREPYALSANTRSGRVRGLPTARATRMRPRTT
jgi:hypothetical protein